VARPTLRCVACSAPAAWLETVTLPADTAVALTRWRHVLTAIQAEAVAADAGVAARAQGDPIARRLDMLVGIGPVLALTIRAKIGDIARFRRGAELASYAGLVPRVDASASRYRTGPITREGSPWLRWAFVEAAVHGIRRPDGVGRWARAARRAQRCVQGACRVGPPPVR
jgi:transposase